MREKLLHLNYKKFLKIALGSAIAIIVAELFGLRYSASAGIITLLTIQNTKKETIAISGKRILSFLMAILIAGTLFQAFGYTPFVFGLFLFCFVAVSEFFSMQDGISMSAVLTTHFLIEKNMSLSFLANEIMIMMIGMGLGVGLNLLIRKNNNLIKESLGAIDQAMKQLLGELAASLQSANQEVLLDSSKVEEAIAMALHLVSEYKNNNLLDDTNYFDQYTLMRKNQYRLLWDIQQIIPTISATPNQALVIASFLREVSSSFHEYNTVEELLLHYDVMKQQFQKDELPSSRGEFENRARLFQIITMLEQYLLLKKEFVYNLSQVQIKRFWI